MFKFSIGLIFSGRLDVKMLYFESLMSWCGWVLLISLIIYKYIGI